LGYTGLLRKAQAFLVQTAPKLWSIVKSDTYGYKVYIKKEILMI